MIDWGLVGTVLGFLLLWVAIARYEPRDEWDGWPDLSIEDVVEDELKRQDVAP